ncbi:profilin-3-like [Anomaloglossus baeobatrachus]|uniref:profilin-3-like n=1 Tax=Anomaloglossus baeobatrachus TaxID=238106 RepID=UPI003F4F81CD
MMSLFGTLATIYICQQQLRKKHLPPDQPNMEEWREYINAILEEGQVEDMAVVSHVDNCRVLASSPGGLLAALSQLEVQRIKGNDRNGFFQTGVTIGGKKYCVIRDNLLSGNNCTMHLVSKENNHHSVCIGMSPKLLIFIKGERGVHGSILNSRLYKILTAMQMQPLGAEVETTGCD